MTPTPGSPPSGSFYGLSLPEGGHFLQGLCTAVLFPSVGLRASLELEHRRTAWTWLHFPQVCTSCQYWHNSSLNLHLSTFKL